MPWTAPRTWATGDIVTAAQMNSNLRDNLLFLETHLHTGGSGQGSAEIGALTSVNFSGAAAPAAPGADKMLVFAEANENPAVRSGAGGAVRRVVTFPGGSGSDGAVLVGAGTGDIDAIANLNKGQLLVGSGTGTASPTALGTSSNDFILMLDSAEAIGVKWASTPVSDVRAWGDIQAGTLGANSKGITTCVNLSAGTYRITWSTAFANTGYGIALTEGTGAPGASFGIQVKSVGTAVVRVRRNGATVTDDSFNVVAVGTV